MRLRRAHAGPGEAEEADGFEEGEEQERLEAPLGGHGVGAVFLAQVVVAPEPRPVQEVGEEVAGVDGDEGPGHLQRAEAEVVWERDGEGFEEGEDQRVGESGEEGEEEDDGLADEHFEGAEPDLAGFFERDARRFELVGAVDVGVFAGFAAPLGFTVEEDGRARLGHEEVDGLHGDAEDELDPEIPLPGEVCPYCQK